jgi:hypothetical protein
MLTKEQFKKLKEQTDAAAVGKMSFREIILPNGKKLADCTGLEVEEFANEMAIEGRIAATEAKKATARVFLSLAPFQNRGLSGRTIDALINSGMDAPERLLFMPASDIRKIPGIDKASMAEIDAYIRRFKEA